MLDKKISVEFKPVLSENMLDVQNFDKMFTDSEAINSVMPDK
jgi:hypothetical protein